MPDHWFDLDDASRTEILQLTAQESGRPAHLLEKDTWVVFALSAIYSNTGLANKLTFKGGTSLSKVYKIIDRFSEDIDLTYDIRELVPDALRGGNPIPESRSHESRISAAVREQLPKAIESEVLPAILAALAECPVKATASISGDKRDVILITYSPLATGSGYAAPSIKLEFGARATGEPHQFHDVTCDMSPFLEMVSFPAAKPLVMAAERTFWEKATAIHVHCLQQNTKKDRFARHWYDLAKLSESEFFHPAISDKSFATAVAQHKSMFFREKDVHCGVIDYLAAVNGSLQLVPSGDCLASLEDDFNKMVEDEYFLESRDVKFSDILNRCQEIELLINQPIDADKPPIG